jgi:hypothetical protein
LIWTKKGTMHASGPAPGRSGQSSKNVWRWQAWAFSPWQKRRLVYAACANSAERGHQDGGRFAFLAAR